ncbi:MULTISPECIES: TRADD-N-associated membrane domain-containing protein [unclassified Streptomyces]|uniref:TRADD-N-associated membrane domain-containing protein n=1 Tax=unclassified Streptomyces TaxID=2593676 RepID=UPI003D8A7858
MVLAQDEKLARWRDRVGELIPPVDHLVGRDQIVNVHVGTHVEAPTSVAPQPEIAPATPSSTLAEQRQKFHFDFLNHTMKQSEWTFRLSVYFMTGGAVVILVAAVLALVHAGSANHGYLPLVTGLSGVLITTGGGALALHSKRTMTNLTKAAEDNEAKVDLDQKLEVATTFIDRIQDKDTKDRLNSAAALRALGMQPSPETMVNRLLPGQPTKEIDPGDPAE